MMQRLVTIACGGLLVLAASRSFAADEALPPGASISSIEAQPAAIELKNRFEYAQVLLTATTANGDRIDATRLVKAEKSADVVEVSPTGLIRPKADGKAEIKFSLGERSVVVPVTVAGNGGDYKVSFVQDVMPTISKLGCNAGTCHGSAQGKNGFKLSLRGYDPVFDHLALTDDLSARRFNRAVEC